MPEPQTIVNIILIILVASSFVLLILLLRAASKSSNDSLLERKIEESSSANRQTLELIGSQLELIASQLNQRINDQTSALGESVTQQTRTLNESVMQQTLTLNERLADQTRATNERLAEHTATTNQQLAEQTRATNERLTEHTATTNQRLAEQNAALNTELARNREELARELVQIREMMATRLTEISQDNSKKLDEMRATVDEKLSETLERRFTESFTLISNRLESVQKGLGEMQILASNVTDLKNILANVKTRGNFGEYQLQTLLEDVLAPDQYETNFAPFPRGQQRVEFAVRLPGLDSEPVYLPIDSKFPIEDYQRLLEAYDKGDKDAIDSQHKALIRQSKVFARSIRDKYLNPPRTTDFAVMFVPTEGLYAELMREPGFADDLNSLKIMLAGPNTLYALISSYRIGFAQIAISKRASEIETLLSAVKKDFSSFQGILDSVDKRIMQAHADIEKATKKTETIQRRLRNVTELPETNAVLLLSEGEDENAEVLLVEDEFDDAE